MKKTLKKLMSSLCVASLLATSVSTSAFAEIIDLESDIIFEKINNSNNKTDFEFVINDDINGDGLLYYSDNKMPYDGEIIATAEDTRWSMFNDVSAMSVTPDVYLEEVRVYALLENQYGRELYDPTSYFYFTGNVSLLYLHEELPKNYQEFLLEYTAKSTGYEAVGFIVQCVTTMNVYSCNTFTFTETIYDTVSNGYVNLSNTTNYFSTSVNLKDLGVDISDNYTIDTETYKIGRTGTLNYYTKYGTYSPTYVSKAFGYSITMSE